MGLSETPFLLYIRKMFKKYGSDYDSIFSAFNSKDKKEFEKLMHFYYFICRDPDLEVRDEIVIVGMTSLMESMMGDTKFMSVFDYMRKYAGENKKIDNIDDFQKKYNEIYGLTNKVIKFVSQNFQDDDVQKLINGIKILKKGNSSSAEGEFFPLESIEKFANFLYQMRSKFVHEAEMHGFCNENDFARLDCVDKKRYDIRINTKDVLDCFEKSMVFFWSKKVSASNIESNILKSGY